MIKIKTKVLPVLCASVLSVCVNTAPFSLTAYASVTESPIGIEEEVTAQEEERQNTEEPEITGSAEEQDKTKEETTESAEEQDETNEGITESAEEQDEAEVEITAPAEGQSGLVVEITTPEEGQDQTEVEGTESEEEPEQTEVETSGSVEKTDTTGSDTAEVTTEYVPDGHHLAFASDYHNTEGSIHNALSGMPENVEYVGMIGDMVGDRGNMRPAYESKMILDLVREVFPDMDNNNVSIIWADHDMNVDDAGTDIVKCMGGTGSGQIFAGTNNDSSPAYYIYGIAHHEMSRGDGISTEAAESFKKWVEGLDHTVPVIVLCHVPIQASRADNKGASYWNEALNYAATGVEGITSTDVSASIIRNVLFLHGHNHTNDPAEHYFGAGGTMSVQVDDSDAQSTGELPGQFPGGFPGRKAEGVLSNIYYTSLTAGYLKTTGNATLVTVSDGALTLTKYNGGQNVSLGTNGDLDDLMGETITIAAQRHIHGEDVKENVIVATCEHNGDHDIAVYCIVCGKEMYRTHVTTKAFGHNWSRWSVVREATETAEGEESRSCTVCGKKEHRSIPAVQTQDTEKPEEPERAADCDGAGNIGNNQISAAHFGAEENRKSTVSPLTGDDSRSALWLAVLCLAIIANTAAVYTFFIACHLRNLYNSHQEFRKGGRDEYKDNAHSLFCLYKSDRPFRDGH